MSGDLVLQPGRTCWRVEHAGKVAFIVDGADYLRHVKAAMLRARHRIMLIGWDFDGRTTMEQGETTLPGPNQLGALLYWLMWKRPDLEIHVLKSNLRLLPVFDDLWYGLTPVTVLNRLSGRRIRFAVDGRHPTGAVHHQKVVVIDDVLAFCGGIDLTLGRWDTSEHLDDSVFRRDYGPRHEIAAAVDGAAASGLGDLARDRWEAATGQSLDRLEVTNQAWPRGLEPDATDVGVGIARTIPDLPDRDEVREVEALNLAAIAASRRTVYLENQYLASRRLADALADRLRDPDGPEIVIVLPRRSESRLEQESMDSARKLLLEELWAADNQHRLGVYWPVTDAGAPIYVHSKILVVDDRLLRIGSSNLNNRSMGFDSECDVAIESGPADDSLRQTITAFRNRLISEHLGVAAGDFDAALQDGATFLEATEALIGEGRTLRRFTADTVVGEGSPLAENELMDPDHVPSSLATSLRRLLTRLGNSRG
ncbi:phospholipase D-like domain-containing protein [Mycolicibacterium fluoranthenivorans]|uniref:Phosphatidylserine/phosphatidylglycerophosphate/ cardiolipin synthase-like enzyme n=1 Tax=Mycolicibacterium fluoranthenivorans TaxID=258505 RepID=A0A7X5TVC2_9MYCO|nr:phospholipase D-like domain-containing protein [Mycolicibacterium fluoranthenivorans]MCV7358660.1 phospholipase [Mycolicibacterium fluoranthenivorans]NIH93347.1 phosphatidylserine/phosphatidylglycerophosphate/cardiolipin synthase-like enzyme [Mycolicibacterium fluoranthenivorans]